MNTIRVDTLDAQRVVAHNVLRQGGRVLVVGSRPNNIPPDLREHPRLLFYDSSDGQKDVHRSIPGNVRLILFTRFLSHETHRWYREQARQRGIHCFSMINGTGEIRSLLAAATSPTLPEFAGVAIATAPPREHAADMVFNPVINVRDLAAAPLHADPPQPDPPPRPTQPVPAGMVRSGKGKLYTVSESKRGAIKTFIQEVIAHFPEMKDQSHTDVSHLAMAEAKSIGLETTRHSLAQCIGTIRGLSPVFPNFKAARIASVGRPPVAEPAPAPVPAPPAAAPPPRSYLTAHRVPAVPAVTPVSEDHPMAADMIKLVDDAITSLQLLREQVLIDIARIQVLIRREAAERMRKMQDLLDQEEQ